MWKNIMTKFRVPRTLILDNGLQFDNKMFHRYCSELGITNQYSTLAYPQGNGQVEVTNKTIINGLKKRLDESKRRWTEELVLWAFRTTPRRSTRKPPFFYDLWIGSCNTYRG